MHRTVAKVLTIVTAFACDIPSIRLLCLGILTLLGTRMPEVMMQTPGSITKEVILEVVMVLFVGAVLLLVPILVGIFSFRFSIEEEPASFDYIPPAS